MNGCADLWVGRRVVYSVRTKGAFRRKVSNKKPAGGANLDACKSMALVLIRILSYLAVKSFAVTEGWKSLESVAQDAYS